MRSDIHCDDWILNNEYPDDESITDEYVESLPEIVRASPRYDSKDQFCFYGIEVDIKDVTGPGGDAHLQKLIAEMNSLFKTTKCELAHRTHVG